MASASKLPSQSAENKMIEITYAILKSFDLNLIGSARGPLKSLF